MQLWFHTTIWIYVIWTRCWYINYRIHYHSCQRKWPNVSVRCNVIRCNTCCSRPQLVIRGKFVNGNCNSRWKYSQNQAQQICGSVMNWLLSISHIQISCSRYYLATIDIPEVTQGRHLFIRVQHSAELCKVALAGYGSTYLNKQYSTIACTKVETWKCCNSALHYSFVCLWLIHIVELIYW